MRLKQYVFPGLVALALCAAGLVAWPAPAQAQTPSTHGGRAAKASPAHVVVRPGDCLWSISQRLLPADATPHQIYNEVARIYALNRDQIGEDPNLIYAGQVLKVAPASTPVAGAAGSGGQGRGAGADIEVLSAEPAAGSGGQGRGAGADIEVLSVEPAPKAAVGEPSRETAQRASHDVSRAAAREPSGTLTHPALPKPAHAPILKPVAKLSPKTASDGESRVQGARLLVAAAVGTGTGWGAMCLFLAVALLAARRLPTKRTTRQEHERWETPAENRRDGRHQRRPEAAPPTPDAPLLTPPPKPGAHTTIGDRSQW